jgi:hypothetical protein
VKDKSTAWQGRSDVSAPIMVRRVVYDAAQKLQKEAEFIYATKPFALGEKKIDEHRASGDKAGAHFWREVYLFMLSLEILDGEVKIVETGNHS